MDYQTRITEIDIELAKLSEVVAMRQKEREALVMLAALQASGVNVVITEKGGAGVKVGTEANVSKPDLQEAQVAVSVEPITNFAPLKKATYRQSVARLLEFIGDEGKTLHDLVVFFESIGKKPTEGKDPYAKFRTELWQLKSKHGLIDNPKTGYYVVSEKGREFIESEKGESPATTGPSIATESHPGA